MSLGKTSRDGSINGATHHNHDEMVNDATGGEFVNATHEYALTYYVSNRWQHKRYVSGWPSCKSANLLLQICGRIQDYNMIT